LFLLALLFGTLKAAATPLELTFQTRNPVTGEVVRAVERVDSARISVVAVDVWNDPWCKTATRRVDAIVPRLNRALAGARDLGMTVLLCPSDVVEDYVGFPQREAVFRVP
jgi:nicotinamidase-related amidase